MYKFSTCLYMSNYLKLGQVFQNNLEKPVKKNVTFFESGLGILLRSFPNVLSVRNGFYTTNDSIFLQYFENLKFSDF